MGILKKAIKLVSKEETLKQSKTRYWVYAIFAIISVALLYCMDNSQQIRMRYTPHYIPLNNFLLEAQTK